MPTSAFFDEPKEQSLVKATIVHKYFDAWARIMIKKSKASRVGYIDLFAGPGRYKDGSASTPLLILEKAAADPDLRDRLVSIFNDRDENNSRSLDAAIKAIPGIGNLKHPPKVENEEVGTKIVEQFEQMKLIPTFFFVDPWGYKGLSLKLVNSVVKDFGCECVFFFNYNRINMGLSNPSVQDHMVALFGPERASALTTKLESLSPAQRELEIVEALAQALTEMQARFVLPFRFRDAQGTRTSYYLLFVTKHVLGYAIMKDIMAREGASDQDGVPSFEYVPATKEQQLLFEYVRPFQELQKLLLENFAGKTLTMLQIYEAHHVGKRFVKKNYKDALQKLEHAGKIDAAPHKKNSFGDDVLVTFPTRRGYG